MRPLRNGHQPERPEGPRARPGKGHVAGRRVASRHVGAVVRWFVPDENPSSAVYGTITAGALLAAESYRHPTVPDAAGSVLVTIVLLWLAEVYATGLSVRLRTGQSHSMRGWLAVARRQGAVIKGALLPILVLLIAAGAGASSDGAVVAALVSAAVLLVLLELAAGWRGRLGGSELAVQVGVGVVLGVGVLVVKALAH